MGLRSDRKSSTHTCSVNGRSNRGLELPTGPGKNGMQSAKRRQTKGIRIK
jgi:hypothetical protein